MKYNKIVKYFENCGMTKAEAVNETESIIKYHTTGVDSVSREYAIEMIFGDLFII